MAPDGDVRTQGGRATANDVGEVQHDGAPCSQPHHQPIERLLQTLCTWLRDVHVDFGVAHRLVARDLLGSAERDAGLEQMGCVALGAASFRNALHVSGGVGRLAVPSPARKGIRGRQADRESNAERLRTFRVVPHEVWSVENNLSIASMDFDGFLGAVDEDGVVRGVNTGSLLLQVEERSHESTSRSQGIGGRSRTNSARRLVGSTCAPRSCARPSSWRTSTGPSCTPRGPPSRPPASTRLRGLFVVAGLPQDCELPPRIRVRTKPRRTRFDRDPVV